MSYSIVGKFFLNDKPVLTSDFSMLKSVNELRYSLTLENVEPIPAPSKVEEYISKDEKFEHNGQYFNAKSFEDALEYFKNKYEKVNSKFITTSNLKNSIEYYKLTDEQKGNFENDLAYDEEELEELEWKLYSLAQIIGVFRVIEDMYVDGEWNYSSNVVLYLEAN